MSDSKSTMTVISILLLLASVATVAWATGRWFLTAIPIGVLFGFFLHKGDLCGSSAFSEIILTRNWSKVWGLWIAIVVSMLGIAVGDFFGWIQLNAKPFMWANVMVGGVVFGVGMVLAGGCVSGCLYKGASGNLNSIAALMTMPFGIAMVEYGPLNPWYKQLKALKIPASDGGPVTLASLTGLPYWLLALVITGTTLGIAVMLRRRKMLRVPDHNVSADNSSSATRIFGRSWKPWQAGIAIGLLALPAYLSSAASGRNYPLGATHGILHAALLVTDAPIRHIVAPSPSAPSSDSQKETIPKKKVVWWLVLLVGSLMIGSHLSGRMSNQTRLLPKPPEQVLVALAGGFLVGIGAALATGCVIGNILSGWALMSIGTVLFGIVTILANWGTTVLYLRGLR